MSRIIILTFQMRSDHVLRGLRCRSSSQSKMACPVDPDYLPSASSISVQSFHLSGDDSQSSAIPIIILTRCAETSLSMATNKRSLPCFWFCFKDGTYAGTHVMLQHRLWRVWWEFRLQDGAKGRQLSRETLACAQQTSPFYRHFKQSIEPIPYSSKTTSWSRELQSLLYKTPPLFLTSHFHQFFILAPTFSHHPP